MVFREKGAINRGHLDGRFWVALKIFAMVMVARGLAHCIQASSFVSSCGPNQELLQEREICLKLVEWVLQDWCLLEGTIHFLESRGVFSFLPDRLEPEGAATEAVGRSGIITRPANARD